MNEIFIYHHLGLGDHIMLNGFVRSVAESYDRTWLFAKPGNNTKNVRRMYQDNSQINIIPLDDSGARDHMRMFPGNNYMVVGHSGDFFRRIDDPTNGKSFDMLFFEDHNIPFEHKWDKFYLKRELVVEQTVYYNTLGLNDDSKYIFIHDSPERPITREIPKGVMIIRPNNKEVGIFDWLHVIEKAQEVHVMNSSFMNLIDSMQLRQDNLFYHEYSRPNINTVLRLPWKILK